MKNVFLTNKLVKTLTIILVFMVIAYFTLPNYVSAVSVGGTLLEPVKDLVLLIGDFAMYIINYALYSVENSLIEIDNTNNFWEWVLVGLGVLVAIVLMATGVLSVAGGLLLGVVVIGLGVSYMPTNFMLPYFTITPQEIFANQVYFLDVNFFEPNIYEITDKNMTGSENQGDEGKTYESTASVLRGAVSSWYYTMLTIASIGFMCILLYIAFKIIITSNTEEKAKYKERIKDWVVGLCLLGTMHFIMVFAVNIVESITAGIAKNSLEMVIVSFSGQGFKEENLTLIEDVVGTPTVTTPDGKVVQIIEGDRSKPDSTTVNYPTNLVGKVRLEAQLGDIRKTFTDNEGNETKDANGAALHNLSYSVIYLVLVFYTVSFLLIYVKRVLYMALLTILAPLVAMYYPIDKITDGQAQGFNTWIKEYAFNLLMQPFHLIIYTMLVGSAMRLAVDNPVYAIVALGCIMPAERLIRQLFQLGNAKTTGESGSMVGTMMGLHMISPFKGSSEKSSSDKGGDSSKVRTVESGQGGQNALPSGSSGGNSGSSAGASGSAIRNRRARYKPPKQKLTGAERAKKVGKAVGKGVGSVGTKVGKAAIKGATAAAGVVVGAAAGIAAGKPSDALKYAATFGGVGLKAGNKAISGVKKVGDAGERKFKAKKAAHLEKKYGTTDKDEIKYVKAHAEEFDNLYGNDSRKWMQEALSLRREGITDEKDIKNVIALQRGETDKGKKLQYNENKLEEKLIQDKDERGNEIAGQFKKEFELKKGGSKNLQLDRESAIKAVKQAKDLNKKGIDLNNADVEKKLHQRMARAYENQGLDGDEEASKYLGALKHIQKSSNNN